MAGKLVKRGLIDDSLWFIHKDGGRLYPWVRYSKHHGSTAFWVSGGSNLIEDAIPVVTMADLVVDVFSRGRSVWLFDNAKRRGLYRFHHNAIHDWGASPEVKFMAIRAGAPPPRQSDNIPSLPTLVSKALADAGYDLLRSVDNEWVAAAVSGGLGQVLVRASGDGVLLAMTDPAMAQRIGLEATAATNPPGMMGVGLARSAMQLYDALRVLHSLQEHPTPVLSARVELRLAAIPETERTREVRQRVGQEVFREALMDLWEGRCAVSGIAFPSQLLRASHAKPWSLACDGERLDPFNGLLLSVHLDAMFDAGLISFSQEGGILCSSALDTETLRYFSISNGQKLRSLNPGHLPYLAWHRDNVFRK